MPKEMTEPFIRYYFFIIFIFILLIALGGCVDADDFSTCWYDVSIKGIDGYTGSNITEIFIPLPMMGEEPVFTYQIQNIQPSYKDGNIWKPDIVSTDHGEMISIKTNKSNLTNISFKFGKPLSDLSSPPLNERKVIVNKILKCPLSPMVDAIGVSDIRSINNSNKRNFTSYVYIDKNLRPIENKNCSIIIDLELDLSEGKINNIHGSRYTIRVHEIISSSMTGWIPVTAQIK